MGRLAAEQHRPTAADRPRDAATPAAGPEALARRLRGWLRAALVCCLLLGSGLLGSAHGWPSVGDIANDTDEPPPPAPAAAAAPLQDGPSAAPRAGRLIRIAAPISDRTRRRAEQIAQAFLDEARRQQRWPVIVFEFLPGHSDFGQALDLARFISGRQLAGSTTVAYLPEGLTGHGLLAAMACDQIIAGPDAAIGKAGEGEETIGDEMRSVYQEITRRRRTVPVDLALGMLDPALEVWQVETEVSREFALSTRLDELRQQRAVQPIEVLIPAGQPGLFTGREARELGFVAFLATDQADVARALGLPAAALEEDPSLGGTWHPIRIDVKGPISAPVAQQLQRLVTERAGSGEVNFICVWIDSPGGSPVDSNQLAQVLAGLDAGEQRTVAYIPREARADAAFIALACDHIVMHPAAELGGWGAAQIPADEVETYAQTLREIAIRKHRPAGLAAALIDPTLVLHRYTSPEGVVHFLTDEQVAALPDAERWQRGDTITTPGRPLLVDGETAERLGLARAVVNDFHELKQLYGLENDPTLVEPGWADFLLDALRSPALAWLLLLIGGAGLYIEVQTPGLGLGGVVATVCFLLYFWSNYLGGTAGWLEVLLFVTGLACVALEVFVLPGFGVFGVSGALLILASLVLASQTFLIPRNAYMLGQLQTSLLVVTGGVVGFVAAAWVARRYLVQGRPLGGLALEPLTGEALLEQSRREMTADYSHLVGRQGTTFTPLVPSGKARFGDEVIDVTCDGDLLPPNTPVVVVAARGAWVLVRPLDGAE